MFIYSIRINAGVNRDQVEGGVIEMVSSLSLSHLRQCGEIQKSKMKQEISDSV